jgi:DNA polymerase I
MLYVVSAGYDPSHNSIVLKLYNSKTEELEDWFDEGYKAYFLTKIKLGDYKGVVRIEPVVRFDGLSQRDIELFKVFVQNPAYVKFTHDLPQCYENHIKFFQGYIFDHDIQMGMPYERDNGSLKFVSDVEAEKRVSQILTLVNTENERDVFENWARLLEYPAPDFKRMALDIEVLNEEHKMPSAESANLPILACCCVSNRGERIAFVLIQPDKPAPKQLPENVKVLMFTDEGEMLRAIFQTIKTYPFVITFNGDDFDLTYLAMRAIRLGMAEVDIPIEVRDRITLLKNAVHIDLYKFFSIRAMQIYAFAQKYKNVDLDTVSKALLGKGKLNDEGKYVGNMSYEELITYCMRDSELTLELTTYNDNLPMNLMLILERISRMPLENVTRKAVSNWILNFVTYEHRRRGYLIPRGDEIKQVKGQTSSSAMIKGKKYKGAVVIPPIGGTHFKTKVGDFASLYPSIMKIYNIGYATINCPHPECQSNKIGELPHWMCTKLRAIESLLIGSLRDLRVNWYKQRAKDKNLNKEQQTWYKVAEQSIKVIMNASYGVFGAETFEFYCPPAAEEITAIGRHVITETIHHGEELGLEILYGDTDSIFIKNPDKPKLDELMVWAKSTFDIEFELDKNYRYVCLSSRKKNYLGVLEDGTVDVKGLTGKKKHTPPIIKNAFNDVKEILASVNTENDMAVAKHQIIEVVKSTYMVIKTRQWKNIKDLAYTVNLTKEIDEYVKNIPQHVQVAKQLQTKYSNSIGSGSSISFIKTNPKVAKGEKVKPTELTTSIEVDTSKYIEFLKTTFEQVLDPLNLSFEGDIEGKRLLSNWCN